MKFSHATKILHNFIDGDALENYAFKRNFDRPSHDNVSQLSPYIRYRAIYEDEVISACLKKYSYSEIHKFIDEVFWRTYWKGWLEHRPQVWDWYVKDVQDLHTTTSDDYRKAISGQTDIECFNHWVKELTNTGYLHNHARMWFASIWIYTLKLPWQLGADFFLQNLLDGDAASNTLSWRWIAGLQTKGKTYLARADNIKKYTDERFCPQGLAKDAPALSERHKIPDPLMPQLNCEVPKGRVGLLVTEDDVRADEWLGNKCNAIAAINVCQNKSPNGVAEHVSSHVKNLMQKFEVIEDIYRWKSDNKLDHIIASYPPVGHVSDYLKGYDIVYIARDYDATCWPYATKGFFKFKKHIPDLIGELNLD